MASGNKTPAQLRAIHAKSKSPSHVRRIGNKKYRYGSVREGNDVHSVYLGKAGST